MTYQGSLWNAAKDQGEYYPDPVPLSPNIKPGDLCAFTITSENYLLRDGQTQWSPADLVIPAGWTLVDWWVLIPGGDPRRIALVRALVARIADESTAGSLLDVHSAIPYHERDNAQDPGSSLVARMSHVESHGGYALGGYWRGETGIAALDRVTTTIPAHTAQLPPGRSRDGGASVARWGEWPRGGGLAWYDVDSARGVYGRPDVAGRGGVIVAPEGQARTVYCFQQIWTGEETYYTYAYGTFTGYALTVSPTSYPLPPIIDAPTTGALLDLEHQGVSISWTHRPSLAGPQAGYVLTCTPAGGQTRWWNAAGRAWATAQVRNPGTLSTADLPASAFPAATGLSHAFTLATYGANGEPSIPATTTVTATVAPTATAGIVGADQAGVVASLRPTVAIGATSPAGLALLGWSASLVDLTTGTELATATGTFDGLATSASWSPGVEVANGDRVRAVVRVQQAGGAWSSPATAEATTDVDTPGAPTLTLTAGTHETSGAPAVRVDVAFPWEDDGYAWTSRATLLRLERRDASGWMGVAEITLPPGRTEAVIDDYAAPAGALAYRARGEGQAVDGSTLRGAWGVSDELSLDVPGGWLIDPARPEAAARVDVVEDGSRSIDMRTQRMAALGRADELVATTTPLLASGSLTLRVHNPTHAAAVSGLLSSGAVLRLTLPAERDASGDVVTTLPGEALWLRPVGDLSTSRPTARGVWSVREIAFDYVGAYPPVRRTSEA